MRRRCCCNQYPPGVECVGACEGLPRQYYAITLPAMTIKHLTFTIVNLSAGTYLVEQISPCCWVGATLFTSLSKAGASDPGDCTGTQVDWAYYPAMALNGPSMSVGIAYREASLTKNCTRLGSLNLPSFSWLINPDFPVDPIPCSDLPRSSDDEFEYGPNTFAAFCPTFTPFTAITVKPGTYAVANVLPP